MWIFTNKGFISVVQDLQSPGNLLVRTRSGKHLEDLFPGREVKETPTHDYRFRVSLPAAEVADLIRDLVAGIDYSNFKNSITEVRYHDAALDVWTTMFHYQNKQRGSYAK